MSAICGIFYLNHKPVEKNTLKKMNDCMKAHGIDGNRIWHHGEVGFGHQMTCLTRESLTETLPLSDSSAQCVITADARLANRQRLCDHFHLQNTSDISDSFLILQAYLRWEKKCPDHLLGEFAVAIWNISEHTLYCFTDHSGQRPLYYYRDHHIFAFASEIDALHSLPAIKREINLQLLAASSNVGFRMNHPELTYFKNIFAMKCRTLYTIKPDSFCSEQYWQPNIDRKLPFRSEAEYIDAFQSLFSEVIDSKIRSHLPVMSLHSGGLDSSAITAMAATLLAKKNIQLTALSAVLPTTYTGNSIDESHYVQLLQMPNLTIQAITDEWRGPFDGINDTHYFSSTPAKTSRHYLYNAFASAAKAKGTRLILDGCFGEAGPSFHGNGYFAELLMHLKWRTFFRESLSHARVYQRPWLKILLKDSLYPLMPSTIQAKLKLRSDISFSKRLSMFKPSFINHNIGLDNKEFERQRRQLNTQHPNHRRHQLEAISSLRLKAGRIHSDDGTPVQLVFPYLDKRLLEFCLALPGEFKIRNGFKRYSIRAGMQGIVPDALRFRTSKEPFSPDFNDRFNRQLPLAREYIASTTRTPLMEEIINFEALEYALCYTMQTNRCVTARDFRAMHMIPRAIYLLAFLATFK